MIDQASAKTGKVRIVILGGGFGGVEAARHLDRNVAKRSDIEVTLVSRDNFSLFTPMLHEVAAGDLEPGDISGLGCWRFPKHDPEGHTTRIAEGARRC
jgi:NADPH-dependent 2,4-dienoyl-CoA reductase/sulfur reductase-like enzyme